MNQIDFWTGERFISIPDITLMSETVWPLCHQFIVFICYQKKLVYRRECVRKLSLPKGHRKWCGTYTISFHHMKWSMDKFTLWAVCLFQKLTLLRLESLLTLYNGTFSVEKKTVLQNIKTNSLTKKCCSIGQSLLGFHRLKRTLHLICLSLKLLKAQGWLAWSLSVRVFVFYKRARVYGLLLWISRHPQHYPRQQFSTFLLCFTAWHLIIITNVYTHLELFPRIPNLVQFDISEHIYLNAFITETVKLWSRVFGNRV